MGYAYEMCIRDRNYIKNSGRFAADHLTLEWVGNIPGKRESRRFEGTYLLTPVSYTHLIGNVSQGKVPVPYGGGSGSDDEENVQKFVIDARVEGLDPLLSLIHI